MLARHRHRFTPSAALAAPTAGSPAAARARPLPASPKASRLCTHGVAQRQRLLVLPEKSTPRPPAPRTRSIPARIRRRHSPPSPPAILDADSDQRGARPPPRLPRPAAFTHATRRQVVRRSSSADRRPAVSSRRLRLRHRVRGDPDPGLEQLLRRPASASSPALLPLALVPVVQLGVVGVAVNQLQRCGTRARAAAAGVTTTLRASPAWLLATVRQQRRQLDPQFLLRQRQLSADVDSLRRPPPPSAPHRARPGPRAVEMLPSVNRAMCPYSFVRSAARRFRHSLDGTTVTCIRLAAASLVRRPLGFQLLLPGTPASPLLSPPARARSTIILAATLRGSLPSVPRPCPRPRSPGSPPRTAPAAALPSPESSGNKLVKSISVSSRNETGGATCTAPLGPWPRRPLASSPARRTRCAAPPRRTARPP